MAKRKTNSNARSAKANHANGSDALWKKKMKANELAIRKRIQQRIQTLSSDRLRVAEDFLAFLEERESLEATQELLEIPGLLEQVQKAEREIRQGKSINWRKLIS